MRIRRRFVLVAGAGLLSCLHFVSPPGPKVDFGEFRALVIHSDDWGLEGWFPEVLGDSLRAALSADVPAWQEPYLHSTLESAAEIDSLAGMLARLRDADGLPLPLQANTILAGPSVREQGSEHGWPVHPSGRGPDYSRPGLESAVDRAIERGVWWPELHGLTHYNLVAYAHARAERDPLAEAAARQGAFAYSGYRRDSELDGRDPDRARAIATESVARFTARFGRAPTSVIAPDYRWGSEDEVAWAQAGLRVVQAKREQIDPSLAPHTWAGRLRKWMARQLFARRSGLIAVERTVDLEPYGDSDPGASQGSVAAAAAVEAAFARGEPGVVSIHRVQLVSTAAPIARAGRVQLVDLVERLRRNGGVRFLVDTEVAQLAARGWSTRRAPDGYLVRNWSGQTRRLRLDDGRVIEAEPGTSVWSDKFRRQSK